ncbi:MAG: hypothetical protein ACI8WT_004020 [Clostridium sp.]|jgi:hypothetical protein
MSNMVRKATFKKINDIIQKIVAIVWLGMGIYYFFINKNGFKEMHTLILWGGICIMGVGRIIDSKYFEDNFSWKKIWKEIIIVPLCAVTVVSEIRRLWF